MKKKKFAVPFINNLIWQCCSHPSPWNWDNLCFFDWGRQCLAKILWLRRHRPRGWGCRWGCRQCLAKIFIRGHRGCGEPSWRTCSSCCSTRILNLLRFGNVWLSIIGHCALGKLSVLRLLICLRYLLVDLRLLRLYWDQLRRLLRLRKRLLRSLPILRSLRLLPIMSSKLWGSIWRLLGSHYSSIRGSLISKTSSDWGSPH